MTTATTTEQESKKYNGWANYETWLVALWIDNDEYTQREAEHLAERAARRGEAAYRLGDTLKEWIEEIAPDLGATMWADLLNAALCEVDWREIAEHYLEDVEETPSEDEDEEED